MLAIIGYLFTGMLAGTLAGLLGIGGGIVVVPMLIGLFTLQDFPSTLITHMAIGTSLGTMMITASSATLAYQRHRLIEWSLFYRLIPGLLLGTICGALLAKTFSSTQLRYAFAVFLIIVALHLLFKRAPSTKTAPPHFLKLSLMVWPVGLLSSFFGIGGGILLVPCFLYWGLPIHRATATSAVSGLPLAIFGTLNLTLTGWHATQGLSMPYGSLGFVYWPAVGAIGIATLLFAPLGTRLAVSLPAHALKRVFALILLIAATSLFNI